MGISLKWGLRHEGPKPVREREWARADAGVEHLSLPRSPVSKRSSYDLGAGDRGDHKAANDRCQVKFD